jgi:hypothetical protein
MTDNDISPEEEAPLAEIAKATGRTLEQVKRVERLKAAAMSSLTTKVAWENHHFRSPCHIQAGMSGDGPVCVMDLDPQGSLAGWTLPRSVKRGSGHDWQ